MACDTLGRPLRFLLTAGQRHDSLTAKALVDGFECEAVLADKPQTVQPKQDHGPQQGPPEADDLLFGSQIAAGVTINGKKHDNTKHIHFKINFF